ncbi:50S ribosomal protein L22/uncharacterised domain fusion protein [Mycobacteroides abscessus subsp. bolletii]|uniref:hypothetical protein n=1 Tax=Mycobacteroides abscessus TaxID=36809 RepID=UPI0009D1020A|nr:hypothetical protein [Mycobacteroides abscessus]SKK41056.1 50S ribosomal protein L22/uncharacterised domain fusion protein [Mycobacteroides abscessus subsp. bolletii]
MGAITATSRAALISIQPRYAFAILDERKTVEFRKRPLAEDVSLAWIYATAPIQRVVGYFTIGRIVADSPEDLWDQYGQVGCIDKLDFDAYYRGSRLGYAIEVDDVRSLAEAPPLNVVFPSVVPPQSFRYVAPHHHALHRTVRIQRDHRPVLT